MRSDDEFMDLGPCCSCEKYDTTVRNIVLYDFKSPHGQGWGCVVCGLEAAGAAAIFCDACLKQEAAPRWLIGFPANQRVPFCEGSPHKHDLLTHWELYIRSDVFKES